MIMEENVQYKSFSISNGLYGYIDFHVTLKDIVKINF